MALKALKVEKMEGTVQIPANSEAERKRKLAALQLLGRLNTDTLEILASKSGKPGIEAKLKQFQHFI